MSFKYRPVILIVKHGVFFFLCTVLSKPIILLHPQNVSVYLGDKPITVIFTCQASGFPPPVIGWVKNDSAVTSGTVVQNGSTSSLVLRLLKGKETPGEYKCIVKNSLGEASSKKGALVIRTQTHGIGVNICTYLQRYSFLLIFYMYPTFLSAFVCLFTHSPT